MKCRPSVAATSHAAAAHRRTVPSQSTKEQQTLGVLLDDSSASLTFSVYFDTRQDTLGDAHLYRLQALAKHLQQHPSLQVSLAGHCDPNGTDEFNNVLAEQRALTVKHMLMLFGIAQDRLDHCGRGASNTFACRRWQSTYSEYRRVDIALVNLPRV